MRENSLPKNCIIFFSCVPHCSLCPCCGMSCYSSVNVVLPPTCVRVRAHARWKSAVLKLKQCIHTSIWRRNSILSSIVSAVNYSTRAGPLYSVKVGEGKQNNIVKLELEKEELGLCKADVVSPFADISQLTWNSANLVIKPNTGRLAKYFWHTRDIVSRLVEYEPTWWWELTRILQAGLHSHYFQY